MRKHCFPILAFIVMVGCGGAGSKPQESAQIPPIVSSGITISDLKYISGPMQNGSDFYYFEAMIYLNPVDPAQTVSIQLEHREHLNPNYPHPDWYSLTGYPDSTTEKYDGVKHARKVTVWIRQTAPPTGPNATGDNFPWMGVVGVVDGVRKYDKLWIVRTPF
ncbi:MAG: hypothetical protein IPP78_14580 [Holophagaceae bacterium]|nr:hypothetical protein [Holophagaceae bacterium]